MPPGEIRIEELRPVKFTLDITDDAGVVDRGRKRHDDLATHDLDANTSVIPDAEFLQEFPSYPELMRGRRKVLLPTDRRLYV